jgi:YgiT-type zinc finger domain-containing protein
MANNKEFDKYKELFGEDMLQECQACGGPLVFEKVNLEDYQGGKLYMMEKVPALVCQECGEVWVPGPVMAEFEKMIETAKQHRKIHGKTRKKKAHGKTRKAGKKK